MLQQAQHRLVVKAQGSPFKDISEPVAAWLLSVGAQDGLLTLFIRHTSASLVIQENADPDVLRDLATWLAAAAPAGAAYRHHSEGPDDMPAHIKAMLTTTSLCVPVTGGRLVLGTWQAIYVVEHRDRAREREVFLHYQGTLR